MANTPCPTCGSNDVTLDYDGVISVHVRDGELISVTSGGVLDSVPAGMFCHKCDYEGPGTDAQAEGLDKVLDENAPSEIKERLVNGEAIFETRAGV